MAAYIALLRAVNVMGTGKLPMTELKRLCEEAGFKSARTYIASGNVVFKSAKAEARVKAMLEAAVAAYTGRPAGVIVRTAAEMAQVHADNPFKETHASRTLAIFLDEPPPAGALAAVSGKVNEELSLGKREIYVHYADGVGESRLKIPAAKNGTARNMNTIAKLAELAGAL
jgi:uncharacterized protein (DUF1697 family)